MGLGELMCAKNLCESTTAHAYVFFWQEYVNDHPQWVKVINAQGVVRHMPWSRVYNDMRLRAGIRNEG